MSTEIHDTMAATVTPDIYKAVAPCSCGERFVEYDPEPAMAQYKAERALRAHLASKGAV